MEKYNLEQAQDEAEILSKKVESGEASTYAEAEKSLETELSPEQIEKIMEKVQDIYAYGTAYTSVSGRGEGSTNSKLESMLKHGLIGQTWGRYPRKNISPEQWGQDVRDRLNPVHFNIMGRTLAFDYNDRGWKSIGDTIKEFKETEPGKTGAPFPRMKGFSREYSPPYLVFDISSFEETDPVFHKSHSESDLKGSNRTYRINAPQSEIDTSPDSNNNLGVGAEYGFQLHHRLPPRLITGVVLDYGYRDYIEKIVKIMKRTFADPEKMVPIYTIDHAFPPHVKSGSIKTMQEYEDFLKESATFRLVWPRQMSYEEVKNFIAEREAKKAEEESFGK